MDTDRHGFKAASCLPLLKEYLNLIDIVIHIDSPNIREADKRVDEGLSEELGRGLGPCPNINL
jgi:hypothetical protein